MMPAHAPSIATLGPALALTLALTLGVVPAAAQAPDTLRTVAERSGWTELTPYDGVVAFYRELTARAPEVRMQEIGRSMDDRAIHLVTLARPAVTDPWEAHATGKPIVFIGAQVHGDEPAGKEALMMLARDLALGGLTALLDDVIFLFVPQINPDGAEGGEWGTRNNIARVNVNRDYLRLAQPETRAVITGVVAPWRPHVLVDAHELVGPPRIYDFYTRYGTSLNGPWATSHYAGERLVPALVTALQDAGYTHFIYHRVPGGLAANPELGLSPGSYGARALSNYGGAHGAISILFESLRPRDARDDLERRTHKHSVAMRALVTHVAGDAAEVVATVARGRAEVIRRALDRQRPDSIAVVVEEAASRRESYRFQSGGQVIEIVTPILDTAVVRLARTRPAAYAIDAARADVADHLLLHGLHVERLTEPATVTAESYRVESVERLSLYEGYIPRVFRTSLVRQEVVLPAGTFIVRLAQPAAAIAIHLLEPDDDNSLAEAGWFEAAEVTGAMLPLHRLPSLPGRPLQRYTGG
jgi:hypothetical protein